MINYADPHRWLVIQYKPGCGGKFLATAYSTIDCVASWQPAYQSGKISWTDYIDSLWNYNKETDWMDCEPQEPWGLSFFSRSVPRGKNLSVNDFNTLASTHGSEYFFDVYNQGLIFVDFYHSASLPDWWKSAYVTKLDADMQDPLWHKQLLQKVCVWDEKQKLGMKIIDKPWTEDCMEAKFDNKWRFDNFSDKQSWLNWAIQSDNRLNFELPHPDIYLNDLFDFNCLNNHVKKIAQTLKSQYNIDNLRYLYDHWVGKH